MIEVVVFEMKASQVEFN